MQHSIPGARRVSHFCGGWRHILVLALWWTVSSAASAQTTSGVQVIDRAERLPVAPAAEVPEEIRLPDAFDRTGRAGRWDYRLQFRVDAIPSEPWGLYVPRSGNRTRVSVNGRIVGQLGGFDGDLSD